MSIQRMTRTSSETLECQKTDGQSIKRLCSTLRTISISPGRAPPLLRRSQIPISPVGSNAGLSRQTSIPISLERTGTHSSSMSRKRIITHMSDHDGIPYSRSNDSII
ncbi:hypothetical protein XAC3810_620039 [Xanthomonas citri pv. citri]|nr:hypothetical protein XAC9322_600040 [Xanthomonas citri pv. citri]CEE45195.1 hypothetical protein XAC3810_620039 [Xanthomonas citri pv. citri]CEE48094.1 hypothetical protein XAC908_870003 [Xanthomonas citri pv. citri]CEE69032.1 hypothetical protein XACLE20_1310008 [Xanthomonas citri pv. citri]CEH49627.1 hypothetical protein XACLE3_6010008 [Xanthomonas citri pv. citri]